MQVKRFVAADMRRALELVRQTLGPDAIILSSSRTAEGIELLTTMGSDSELLQLQQQPLGKMALASASPMISDDAWSPMVAEREARNNFSAPAIQSSVPSIHAKRGKTGRQLADEIEQARARMLAHRKAEESAKEFLVGKNTRVNAGIPRYADVKVPKEEPRYAPSMQEESRYASQEESRFSAREESRFSAPASAPAKQETRGKEGAAFKGAIADRARSATSVNPLRDREELRPTIGRAQNDYPGAIADRARNATGANPTRSDVRAMGQEFSQQDSASRNEVSAAKKESKRPASSQVTIPPRRVPVPRPVLAGKKTAAAVEKVAEKKAAVVKPKSAMTAAERYPLIDDEPYTPAAELPQPESYQPQVPEIESRVLTEPSPLRFVITAENDVPAEVVAPAVEAPVVEMASNQPATTVSADTAKADLLELQALHNNKYFLDIQSEIANMRSLLEQQLKQQLAPAAAVVASVAVTSVAETVAPAAVVPAVGVPAVGVPAVGVPAVGVPAVEAPAATIPEVVVPAAEAPVVETPAPAPEVKAAEPNIVDEVAAEPSVSLPKAAAVIATEDDASFELTLELPEFEIPTLTAEVDSAEYNIISSQASALAATVIAGVAPEDGKGQLLELQSEIADMRFALEQQINRLTEGDEPMTSSSILATVSRRLERAGLPEDVVSKVVNDCRKTENLNEAWPEAMAVLARQLPVVGRDIVDEGGVFAFVGPTGVGKTTTIGKLAARYVLKHGADKVALITTDTYRIASHEQLRSIARILKVPVKVVDENNSLENLLKSLSHCAVVLIDTAGFRHGDPQLKAQLATFSGLPQVKTFVVLSTNCQAQMLKASVHAHGEARLQGCVLTKLDETSSLGEALGVVIKGWLPVAYTTDGQDIPKDLDVARSHQLVAKAIAMIKKNPISAVS